MLLSELQFGSFLTYSVRGEDPAAIESQLWMRRLKNERYVGDPPVAVSSYVAQRLRARFEATGLASILSRAAVVVPVPSSQIAKPATLWVPLLLANGLVTQGLARACEPCLERAESVPKAATSSSKDRPTALRHYESFRARKLLFPPDEIVLVDDVVTRGATLLGAASRLQEVAPKARIHAFAVMRAISEPSDFKAIFDPCVGAIQLREDGSTTRRP